MNKEAKILIDLASYRAMTCRQCIPATARLDQYVNHDPRLIFKLFQSPACIQGPASISTITSEPRPVFEARLVFKLPGSYSRKYGK